MVLNPAKTLNLAEYFSKSLGSTRTYGYYLPGSVALDSSLNKNPSAGLPVLILLHGHDCNFRSWSEHTRIASYLSNYGVLTVFPDSDNSWYSNRFDGSQRYEDDLVIDMINDLDLRFGFTRSNRRNWAIGGMSMGGYGAVKMTIKYPEIFSCGFSHGGAFERVTSSGFHSVFGDSVLNNDFRTRESLIWNVEQLLCLFPPQRPQLFIDCGLSDPLLECNRRFANHLTFLGYPHIYIEAPGHHTWPYWNRAFRKVLPSVMCAIGAQPINASILQA